MGLGTKDGGFFFLLVLSQATLPPWHQHVLAVELGTWVRGRQGTGVPSGGGCALLPHPGRSDQRRHSQRPPVCQAGLPQRSGALPWTLTCGGDGEVAPYRSLTGHKRMPARRAQADVAVLKPLGHISLHNSPPTKGAGWAHGQCLNQLSDLPPPAMGIGLAIRLGLLGEDGGSDKEASCSAFCQGWEKSGNPRHP